MRNFSSSVLLHFIGGACQIYQGMGLLGLTEGFVYSGSLISGVIGVLLLCSGFASFWVALQTPAPQLENLPLPTQEVLSLATAGERIAAIKGYRKQTGASLKDAKQVIDNHLASLRNT